MKKICFVTTVHGTLRSFVLKFAQYLHNEIDCQIHFICNPNEEFQQMLPDYIHFHPVPMKRGISLGGIRAMLQMRKIFKQERFDLVQYSTPNASFYASVAAKTARIPVRLYCQWGMVYVSMKGIKRFIFKSIEKLTCRLSTHIEPDSFGNLRFGLEEKLYPEGKGSVVWNGSTGGIDLQQFDIAQKQLWRTEIRAKYGIPENVFLYGFVGRITRDKGINELLAAFQTVLKAHPTARLMLVGGIECESLLDKERLLWARNCPNIVFTGNQRRIERFYSALDAFVLPSYREGFGSVVIEAEAMEVPVIATQIPGPAEAMQKDYTGLMVPKQDVNALADAMCRLYENPALCAKFGNAGRIYVEDRFEQQAFYRYTLEDRKKILGIPEKQKKICFVTTVHGTLRAFVLKLAEYLHVNANYDISFICNPNEVFESSLPEYIHFFPVPMERGISLGGIGAMLKMLKIFHREKFDLVQYSTPNASLYASLAAWLARIPVRLYCQWGMAYVGFSGVKRKLFKTIEKTVCRLSTWVEPDSHGNLEFSHAEGLYPENKGSVNWNGSASGVDLQKFDISQKQVWRAAKRSEYAIDEDAFVYGFIGRITGDKGINELFTAFRDILERFPNARLMMVGSPEKADSVDASLYEWAQNEPRVLFCGYTNVVEQYLSAMDVYILPSYREGFGSAVIEAEAMGVPVIVTDIPGPTNAMLRDETGLVVPKKDTAALRVAMETVLTSPELCRKFGEAGYRFASERFEQKTLFGYILEDRKRLLGER